MLNRLITGARQVGKTYSIREFGKAFKSFIEINFIENPDAVGLFKNAKGSADILMRLSTITNVPMIKGDTLQPSSFLLMKVHTVIS